MVSLQSQLRKGLSTSKPIVIGSPGRSELPENLRSCPQNCGLGEFQHLGRLFLFFFLLFLFVHIFFEFGPLLRVAFSWGSSPLRARFEMVQHDGTISAPQLVGGVSRLKGAARSTEGGLGGVEGSRSQWQPVAPMMVLFWWLPH